MKKKKIDFNQYADRKLDDLQLSEVKGGNNCPTPVCDCWFVQNSDANTVGEIGTWLYNGGGPLL